jgi:DNA modification methylase
VPDEEVNISTEATQVNLFPLWMQLSEAGSKGPFLDPAFALNRDVPVHRWVPWVAGYSQVFAADAIKKYTDDPGCTVLDPFAGVGTTLVEAYRLGHRAIGFEINPYACFAASVKVRADRINPQSMRNTARAMSEFALGAAAYDRQPTARPPRGFKTRSPFYSPNVMNKVLTVMDFIQEQQTRDQPSADLIRLAFAATMVDYSNYSYEPSLGRKSTVGRPEINDFPVTEVLADKINQMADDADWYNRTRIVHKRARTEIHQRSFLDQYHQVRRNSVDLIVTSPPYMNNYHYNRNTRPQMYWLGFCHNPSDLKSLETLNFGTYWQNARYKDEVALNPSITDPGILETLEAIRLQNADRGVYGGAGWANYATTYLNDCVRFILGARWALRPGGTAVVVIGNSIVQGIQVPTDIFLGRIAELCGLEVIAIQTPRQARVGNSIVNSDIRTRSQKRHQLYESVVEIRQVEGSRHVL